MMCAQLVLANLSTLANDVKGPHPTECRGRRWNWPDESGRPPRRERQGLPSFAGEARRQATSLFKPAGDQSDGGKAKDTALQSRAAAIPEVQAFGGRHHTGHIDVEAAVDAPALHQE